MNFFDPTESQVSESNLQLQPPKKSKTVKQVDGDNQPQASESYVD